MWMRDRVWKERTRSGKLKKFSFTHELAFFVCFFFGGARDQTQDVMHARPLCYTPAPLVDILKSHRLMPGFLL